MTWFKVDDGLCTHRKPRTAGLAAMGLWTLSGSYCSQQLTDGLVPEWYVTSWPNGRKLADVLVKAGLWERTEIPEAGWQFHDWHQSNPTREEELERKNKLAKRQAEWRRRRRQQRETDDEDYAVQDEGHTA